MKTFFSCISIIIFSGVFAQDTQLLEGNWYLHKVVLNGDDIFPPQVNDINLEEHTFYENNGQYFFYTGYCGSFDAEVWFEEESMFTMQDDPAFLAWSCNLEESIEFAGHYISIFYPTANANNPFAYTITSGTGDDKLLVITNPEGDSAHYGNFMLSNTQFKDTALQIYPNPVVDELNIETGVSVAVVKIYTADGREVATENLLPEQAKINVGGLSKGIYILQLTDEQDRVYTSKFIKM